MGKFGSSRLVPIKIVISIREAVPCAVCICIAVIIYTVHESPGSWPANNGPYWVAEHKGVVSTLPI